MTLKLIDSLANLSFIPTNTKCILQFFIQTCHLQVSSFHSNLMRLSGSIFLVKIWTEIQSYTCIYFSLILIYVANQGS